MFQTAAIGAFLANEAKNLVDRGSLKPINDTLALPLGKVNQLNLHTDFSAFSVNFRRLVAPRFRAISLGGTQPITLPSQFVITAAINAGILINAKTQTYTDGVVFAGNLADTFSLEANDRACFVFVAALVDLLLDEGYFRYKHIETLLNLHVGSLKLHRAIDYIFKFANDKSFILRVIPDPNVLKELTFNEVIIAKAIFYLLQTFQIRDTSKIPGRKPKFLASNLLVVSDPYITDVVVLYGALYAASDHYVSLFRKPYYLALTELFGDFMYN